MSLVRPSLLAALWLTLSACATTSSLAPPVPAAALDEATVDAIVARATRQWPVPGLAVVVVKDGQVLLAKGYGVRTLGSPQPVDADTLFAIASLSKAFTATGVGMLVQDGKLQWDDKVVTHLPSFALSDPAITSQVTVRDLLTHRVGLPTFGGDVLWFLSDLDRPSVLRSIRHVPLGFPFRSGYGYSNLMYLTAGELFGATTGQGWEEFTRARILGPLGMTRTAMTLAEAQTRPNRATAHTNIDQVGFHALPDRNVDVVGAAASMYSSANELGRWLLAQLGRGQLDGRRILSQELMDETWTVQNALRVLPVVRGYSPSTHFNGYGLGWFLGDYAGRMIARHGGALSGMYSFAMVVPEEHLAVAVLTNADSHGLYAAVPWAIVDAALGKTDTDWVAVYRSLERTPPILPAGHAISPQDFPRFAGRYLSPHYGALTVSAQEGQLRVTSQLHPSLSCLLSSVSARVLRCPWSIVEFGVSDLTFREDLQGFSVEFHPTFIDNLTYEFVRQPR
ncbi:MAG: beta-lactamase family protein [Myxococcota bacterium]|nr:beta-lactamase family protein [Myxococcota bacterium]